MRRAGTEAPRRTGQARSGGGADVTRADRSGGLVAAAAVAAPVVVGALYSLAAAFGVAGPGATGFTLRRVSRVLSDPAVLEGVLWTLWASAAATALATLGAIVVAATFRGPDALSRAGRTAALLPLPLPHVVAALCGLLILGQSGLLSRLGAAAGVLDQPADAPALVQDRAGVGFILTLAWKELPFLVLVAVSVLARRGVALEETARSLGAPPLQTFARVTVPVVWRGLLPAVVAVFTFVAGSYEVAALLAPSDPLALPLQILERGRDPALELRADAYVLALVALALAGLAVAVHELVRARWGALDA